MTPEQSLYLSGKIFGEKIESIQLQTELNKTYGLMLEKEIQSLRADLAALERRIDVTDGTIRCHLDGLRRGREIRKANQTDPTIQPEVRERLAAYLSAEYYIDPGMYKNPDGNLRQKVWDEVDNILDIIHTTPPQPTAVEGDDEKSLPVYRAIVGKQPTESDLRKHGATYDYPSYETGFQDAAMEAERQCLAARPISADDERLVQMISDEVEAAIGSPSGRSHQAARQILRDIAAAQQEVQR